MKKPSKESIQRLKKALRALLIKNFDIDKRQNTTIMTDRKHNRIIINTICKWCNEKHAKWIPVHSMHAYTRAMFTGFKTDRPVYLIIGKEFLYNITSAKLIGRMRTCYNIYKWLYDHTHRKEWIYDLENFHLIILYEKNAVRRADRLCRNFAYRMHKLNSPVFGLWENINKRRE